MKKIFIIIGVAAAVAGVTSCRTTEANYRAAYERTIARQNEGIDSSTAMAIERENGPRNLHIGDSITLPVISRFVKVTEDGGGVRESLKMYSVVVAKFTQLFNAKSMRERLVDSGAYPGAFVVQSGGEYFVITESTDSPAAAKEALERVKTDKNVYMKPPMPWVLKRPR